MDITRRKLTFLVIQSELFPATTNIRRILVGLGGLLFLATANNRRIFVGLGGLLFLATANNRRILVGLGDLGVVGVFDHDCLQASKI